MGRPARQELWIPMIFLEFVRSCGGRSLNGSTAEGGGPSFTYYRASWFRGIHVTN